MNKPNTVHVGKIGQRIVKQNKPHLYKRGGYWRMNYVGLIASGRKAFDYEIACAHVIDLNGANDNDSHSGSGSAPS